MTRPWLTENLGRTGGTFTPSPTDFVVEEIPQYEASGEGDHLYLRVEKIGLTTRSLVDRAARIFDVSERDVGYAGLKDKNATTTQTLSVLGAQPEDAPRFEGEGIRVLEAKRHRNKLKVGHLAGNRFRATIRNVGDDAAELATTIMEHLSDHGMANFYGEQRFGADGNNVERARQVLQKGPRAAGSRWKAKFLVSALQSHLFNTYLEERMRLGQHNTVRSGDMMVKVDSGGPFVCDDPDVDQGRYDAFEISISGPIFGLKMRRPTEGSTPAQWEEAIMAQAELTLDDFQKVRKFASGTRRPLRAPVTDVKVDAIEDRLDVQFTLRSGSYATVLLDELIKPEPSSDPS